MTAEAWNEAHDPSDLPAAGSRGDHRDGVDRRQEEGTGPAVRSAFADGVLWTGIGAAVGALIALPLALVVLPELDVAARLSIVAAVGAVAGSVVGFALAAGRSDDGADNGLGARDAQAEEDAGFEDHVERVRQVGLAWRDPQPDEPQR